jgi:hypothetical protein
MFRGRTQKTIIEHFIVIDVVIKITIKQLQLIYFFYKIGIIELKKFNNDMYDNKYIHVDTATSLETITRNQNSP